MAKRFWAPVGVFVLGLTTVVGTTGAAGSVVAGGDGSGPYVGAPSSAGQTSKPLAQIARELPAARPGATRIDTAEGLGRSADVSSSNATPDGRVQTKASAGDAPQELTTPLVTFAGQTSGFTPPDPVGDVGPTQYVQMINSNIAVYAKTGAVLSASTAINNLWINGTTAGTGFDQCRTQNAGDPIVLYDQQADRWMVSQFTNPNSATGPGGTYPMCIAYSQTGDATGNWWLYQFNLPDSHDYMKYGIWPDGLYMSTFEGGSLGAYVFDRSAMLSGSPATFQYFSIGSGSGVDGRENRILPADWDGNNPPPPGAPNPFAISFDDGFDGGSDRIVIREFATDWTNPANSTFNVATTLNTVPFDTDLGCAPTFRDCIPQPGTTQKVDAISNRLMHRLQYRNFGSHQSMVVSQTVDAGSNRAGVRWYELRNTGGGWTIAQQSTYAPNDGVHRWMPSAAMDGKGDIAIAYSVSDGTSTFPGLRYTARLASEAPSSMSQGERTLVAGTTSQTGSSRWGDYSALTVDPVDDCTFWYTGQVNGVSGTQIGSFRLPSCSSTDLSVTKTASPTILNAGSAVTFTITVTNNGPNTANAVTLTDTMPTGIPATGSVASNGGTCAGTTTVTCTWPTILAGASANVTIQATVPHDFAGSAATNTATVAMANQADTNLGNNTASASISVTKQADLEIHKYVEPFGSVAAGQIFIYTIWVDNVGPSTAQNVVIQDTLLSHPDISIQSCAFSVSQGGGAITQFTCTTGSLVQTQFGTDVGTFSTNFLVPFGQYDDDPDPMVTDLKVKGRLRASFRLLAKNATTITNTSRVFSTTPDPVTSNNYASVDVNVVPAADLSITKTASPEPVVAGNLLTYTLTVANNGPSVATNVVVKDDLPASVSVVSVTSTGNSCTAGVPGDAAQPLTCNMGTMVAFQGSPADGAGAGVFDNTCEPPAPADGQPCAPETITVVVRVKPDTPGGTLLFNQARVSSDVLDPINSNNSKSATTTVVGSADLSISKTGLGPNPWVSGEQRTYRIDVTNLGPSLAKDVVVNDVLPDGVVFVAAYLGSDGGAGAIPAPCTVSSDNEMECRLGDLSTAAGVKRLFVQVKVKADVPDGTTVSNTATVSSDTPDGVPGNNSDTEDKVMTIEADLGVVITTESDFFPDPLLYVIGEGVVAEQLLQEFTITATNHGPSDAQKVLVTVDLPPAEVGYYIFDDGGCTKIDYILACPIGTLAAGESWTFHYMFHINDDMLFVTTTAHIDVDDDLDLVPNNRDLCDGTALGTAVDIDGCPTPDADGDWVVDATDACPSTPIGTTVDVTGCPAPDADADGVRDAIDLCPGTAPGTLVNLDGCDDEDQDQVVDGDDECPGTEPNRTVTLIGCPLDPDLSNNDFTKTLVDADGELPETGANTSMMAMLGGVFLLGGFGLLGLGRRRRRGPGAPSTHRGRKIAAVGTLAALGVASLGTGAASAASSPWTVQFGTSWFDGVGGTAVSSCGNVVVAGSTMGTFPGKKKVAQADAYVVKFSASGTQRWLREFGTAGKEQVTGVAIAPCGSIYVVGYTDGEFPKATNAGGYDGFIAKFSSAGTRLWVRQFGTAADDMPRGIAVSPSGYVYVTGLTTGSFPLFANAGSADGFLAKFSSGGTQKWVTQFGSAGWDEMTGVSSPRSNEIYLSGETDGDFPLLMNYGDVDGLVLRFDSTGTMQWVNQFGTSSYDHAIGVAATKAGAVYIAGYTGGALAGANAGEADAYLARFDAESGAGLWGSQWGTAADDDAAGVAISKDGIVVGGSTYGAFPTFANAGGSDGYAAVFDGDGNTLLLRQFGTSGDETVSGVGAAKANGDPIVAGGTLGAFPGFTNAGNADAFVMDVESELGETL